MSAWGAVAGNDVPAGSGEGGYALWHAFTDDIGISGPPLRISSGDGAWLVTDSGRRLLNGFSGLSLICGMGNREIERAIADQLSLLPSCSLFRMTYPAAERLAGQLVDLVPGPMERVLLLNSGAEAVEGAVKIARQHFELAGQPDRKVVFSFENSYHGSSFGAMALSGLYSAADRATYRAELPDLQVVAGPTAGWCDRCGGDPCGARCLEPLARMIDRRGADRCAAVIVEPVFAAGGVIEPAAAFFDELQRICTAAGMLLIADESATGFGRTGSMFAFERTGLVPDLVVLAKALSGGYLPLGAVVTTGAVYQPFSGDSGPVGVLSHGSSSSGNPLAVAAALAVLDVVRRDDYPGRAKALGERLTERLADLAGPFRQVRTVGLLCCVELETARTARPSASPALDLYERLVGAGVVTHVKKNRISLFPPLVSGPEEIEHAARAFGQVADDYR